MNRLTRILPTAVIIAFLSINSAFAQTPSTTPTLKIITPGEGQTTYGTTIPILFAVENFKLVDFNKTPAPNRGEGHIHVWLDDNNPTKDSAKKVIADADKYTDVPYGNHTLKAELVSNNHTSLTTPPVVTTVKFKNAPAASPSPAISSGFDKNTALVILVVVALVIVAAWWYTKEEDEGKPAKSASSTRKTVKRKPARKRRK